MTSLPLRQGLLIRPEAVANHSLVRDQVPLRRHRDPFAYTDSGLRIHVQFEPAHHADANQRPAGQPVLLVQELAQIVEMIGC